MQKKFRSKTAALRFAAVSGMKVKQGKATKLADGTKAHWFTMTKSTRAKAGAAIGRHKYRRKK